MYRQIILVINKTNNFCICETIKTNPIGETNEQVSVFTLLFLCYSKFYPFLRRKRYDKIIVFHFRKEWLFVDVSVLTCETSFYLRAILRLKFC